MAKDFFHQHVRASLEKEGWVVTHDPYYLIIDDVSYPIDLGAEQMLGAEKGTEKIAVEVKSFLRDSLVNEFHTALGQYLDYETNLPEQDPERLVFLAVAEKIYQQMSRTRAIMNALSRFKIRVLVFDPELKIIVSWIKH